METFFGRPLLKVGDLREHDHFLVAYEGTTELRPHLGHVLIFQSQFDQDKCLVFDSRGVLDYVHSELFCVRATFNEILESQGIEIKTLGEIPRGADVNILEEDRDSPVPGTYKIIGSYYVFRTENNVDIRCRDNEDELRFTFFPKWTKCYQTSPDDKKPNEPPEMRPTIAERSIQLE